MRRSLRTGAAALLAVSAVAGAAWVLSRPHQAALTVPPTVHQAAPPGLSAAVPAAAGAARIPPSPPASITIPAIGVHAPVIAEGLTRQHALEMPPLSEHNLAGWYDHSVMPGQRGPSVIAGHVDSRTGTSVFFNIRYLKPGDKILVTAADHRTVSYTVQWVQEAAKTAFPTQAVYGPVAYPALRLVTCGGPFDSATGHYQDNVIVYAALT